MVVGEDTVENEGNIEPELSKNIECTWIRPSETQIK